MLKHRNYLPSLFIILYFCSFIVPVVSANIGGYTVEPITSDMDPGMPLETVKGSVWSLTPLDIATILALSISPLLLFPVELFFFLKIFVYLGYRKIRRINVLDNNARCTVYQCIQDNPGIFFMEISNQTHVKPGTLRYHLGILEVTGKITLLKSRGHSRYFENSGRFSVMEQKIVRFLRNDTERSIFTNLLRNPETTRKDLETCLGISGAAVSWHMNRLREEGVLLINKTGRNARYELSPDARRYLEKYCMTSSEAIAA